jgi:PilZ domain-containing protein
LISLFYVYPFSCQLCGQGFSLFQPGVRYFRVDEDQREYQRIRVDLPIRLLQGTSNSNGAAIDISMRGCTVRNIDPLPLGTVVKISLKLPNVPETVAIEAIVRNRSDSRIGLEFLRFEGEDRQRLRHFVQGLLDSQYHEHPAWAPPA